MFKPYNILNLGFPLYLIGFEILLRIISKVDASIFVGPALAASGLGLTIGAVKPKKPIIDPQIEQLARQQGSIIVIRDSKDEKIVFFAWISILLGLLLWFWCCAVCLKNGEQPSDNKVPLYIGIGSYLLGVLISSFKEG